MQYDAVIFSEDSCQANPKTPSCESRAVEEVVCDEGKGAGEGDSPRSQKATACHSNATTL